MTLHELEIAYKLPPGVVQVCEAPRLHSLPAIQAYLAKHDTFLGLQEADDATERCLLSMLTTVRLGEEKELEDTFDSIGRSGSRKHRVARSKQHVRYKAAVHPVLNTAARDEQMEETAGVWRQPSL